MKLDVFHRQISDMIGRGTSLDPYIPGATRRAARWIESNETLQYMQRFGVFTIDSSDTNPRLVDFPNDRLKKIEFIRLKGAESTTSGASYDYLTRVDPEDVPNLVMGKPTAYWLDGRHFIVLDSTPKEDYDAEIAWTEYTAWPTDSEAEPWLLTHAESLMIAQTMLNLHPWLRDDRMVTAMHTLRDEELRALRRAESELLISNSKFKMEYS